MSIATVLSKLAAGARLSAAEAATLAEARAAAPDQKMLQAMYRGYAGDPEATAASQFFLTPQPRVADFYAAKRSQQTGRPGHVDRVLVDPEDAGETYGHSTISLPELGFKDPMYTTARRKVSPEQIKTREQLYAQGGPVSRPMEHKRSEGQDASTQPLTGSAFKALVRGWMAGTAGLPGDLEGLARAGLHMGAAPDSWFAKNVSRDPALPTSEFYKEWLPGKQQGDDVISAIGSVFGGVGATKPIALGKGALSRIAAASPGPMAGSLAAQRGVIKAPGGNWLSGSVEDALKGLKNPYVDKYKQAVVDYGPDKAGQYVANPGVSAEALNTWIDKKLGNYVRNDMATERDPIRALAEQGIIHADLHPFGPAINSSVSKLRSETGFPISGSGKSDLAKTWENVSDSMLRQKPASYYQQGIGEVDDWLTKVPPETAIYQTKDNSLPSNLGFGHLMDELRNAVDINSGLPAHLRLAPESLARVSVPQAVERVAKINDWRAAQKAEADLARANNAATVLHKDYPGKGFKWVELKRGEAKLEGLSPEERKVYDSYIADAYPPEHALKEATERSQLQQLRDALKYEGDTMGHCVGGYCDDVASGKSRIYSLRDAKGQPHTTIEVAPSRELDPNHEMIPQVILDEASDASMTLEDYLASKHPQFMAAPNIVQIKGKGNRAPNPEYLPYVQDFVKSSKWSDVGDLHNTGLRRAADAWNPNEEKMIKEAGIEFPTYATQQEIDAINQQVWPGVMGPAKPPGFAGGGSVRGAINAAIGSSNLAKQVGSSADAVRSIAAGNGSLGDLNSLRQMASELGYTAPGLSQAMGLAATAKAGYNMATDPTGTNAAKFAAKVNPIAAQALSLYKMATDVEPADAANFIVGFHPLLQAYNGLADSFGFANIGQLAANLTKIGNPEAPAQLRDTFSNNPNSDALTRTANDIAQRTGADSMDALMGATGAFGTEPGYTGYYSGVGGDTSSASSSGSSGGSFPSYSGGDRTDGRSGSSGSHSIGG